MNRTLSPLALILLSLLAVPTLANDLRPPDYRFEPLSTVAGWDFLTDQDVLSIRPDGDVPLVVGDTAPVLNTEFPRGAPYPSAATFGSLDYTYDQNGGYFGYLPGERGLVFVVPNHFEEKTFKRLRLQVTYQGDQPPTTVVGYQGIPGTSKDVLEIPMVRVPVQDPGLAPGTEYFYEDWLLFPSSQWEQVVVFLPEETILLHVVIDTVIDEPSSDGLFEDQFEPGGVAPWEGK